MKTRHIIFLPTIVISFLFFSCPFLKEKKIEDLDTIISTDIVMREPALGLLMFKLHVSDSMAYVSEPEYSTIAAFDLEKGTTAWRVKVYEALDLDKMHCGLNSAVFTEGENAWIAIEGPSVGSYLCAYDRKTGEYKKAFKINFESTSNINNNQICIHSNRWYFMEDRGLSFIDPTSATLIDAVKELYSVTPVFVSPYADPANMFCHDMELFGDSILYQYNNPGGSEKVMDGFVRFDLLTNEVRWSVSDYYISDAFMLYGNLLVTKAVDVHDRTNLDDLPSGDYAWNWDTGELEKYLIMPKQPGYNAAVYSPETDCYFTATHNTTDIAPGSPSLYCIDAKTWKIKWQRPVRYLPDSINGQVKNGILYHVNEEGMSLYDERTGQRLGIDPNVWGDVYNLERSVRYNDLFIIKNGEAIFAVKMNWKIVDGVLVKE